MNTIEEILRKKNESIFETYARVICKECNNRHNDIDLCEIRKTQDNTARCENYSKCMQAEKKKKSWNGITAKRHKPIMKV